MQKNAHQRQKVNKVKCLKGQEDDKERVKVFLAILTVF